MKAHLGGSVLTLAVCWRVVRKDGAVFGFTSLDEPLEIAGLVYKPQAGIAPTSTVMSADGAVANSELAGVLSSEDITEADLEAGLWSYASIEIFWINWADLGMGTIPLQAGNLGQITLDKGSKFSVEMRSLGQLLQLPIGDVDGRTCPQQKCACLVKLALPEFLQYGRVSLISTSGRVITDPARTEADDYFKYGKLTFTAGKNSGLSQEIYSSSGRAITLLDKFPNLIAIGDTYALSRGVDGSAATCKSVQGNLLKFAGKPYILNSNVLVTPAQQ